MSSRIKKFLSYYQPYLGKLSVDLACAVLVSIIALSIPLCIRFITKNVLSDITPNALNQIYTMGGVMVLLVLIHTVCNMFVAYHGHVMGAMMERDMRSELFAHFQKLSFAFYDEQKTGQLMTRITNDSFNMGELYHHGPEDIIISVLHFAGALLILFTIDIPLTLIVFLFLPIMFIYARYFNKIMKVTLRQSKDRVGDINAQVEDSLAGIRVVSSFTNEAIEIEKFNFENERLVKSRRADIRSETFFYEGLVGFTLLMTVAVVIFGSVAIVNGTLDLADLITFLLYVGLIIEPINRFGNFTRLYQEGITGFERFMEVLEIEPDIQDSLGAKELIDIDGNVEFRNITFRYAKGNDVLRDLSLTVTAGEYVAIVGPSGVGKTTLCSLIPRFYEIEQGSITIDGYDLQQVQLKSLRRQIGIVQQDIYLFAGTVAENILYGNLNATHEEVIAAAQKANAHNFISALPNGYDTDIGQRGVKLSGGQKQRLSIARVFLKNPPIVIFDEATSALDNESERAVQNSLEALAHNRTTLVIAHRLSTIRNAQRIVVISAGGIAEQGTHEELVAKDGVYAGLYQVQVDPAT